VGDLVRFKPQTNVRFSSISAADEVGTVVEWSRTRRGTGPTYMMMVKFRRAQKPLPYVFRFEYELVKAGNRKRTTLARRNIIVVEPHGPFGNSFCQFGPSLRKLPEDGSKAA